MVPLPPERAPHVVCQYARIHEQIYEKLRDCYVTAKKMKVLNMASNLLQNVVEIGSQPIVEVSPSRQHTRPMTGWTTQSRKLRAKGEVKIQDRRICVQCNTQRIFDPRQSAMICESCGDSITVIDESTQPKPRVVNCHADYRHAATYENIAERDATPVPAKIADFSKSSTAYKRKNHFRDVLMNIQAKSNFRVEQQVIDFVIAELYRQRFKDEDFPKLRFEKIKEIVHRFKLTKYYSHTRQIHSEITGIPPPIITDQHVQEMFDMFDMIQEPFERHRGTRSSMLPCHYLYYKFCEMKGWTQYLEYFHLLKTREKIKQCDRIWEPICHDLADQGFIFIPTDVLTY